MRTFLLLDVRFLGFQKFPCFLLVRLCPYSQQPLAMHFPNTTQCFLKLFMELFIPTLKCEFFFSYFPYAAKLSLKERTLRFFAPLNQE